MNPVGIAAARLSTMMGLASVILYLLLVYHYSSRGSVVALQQPVRQSDGPSDEWRPPLADWATNLDEVIHGSGTHGFIYNSSILPTGVPYGTYNWCNMPHIRKQEYPVPPDEFDLAYVEVIHRHHKRTPYASNTFPKETYPWDCSDQGLFYYGEPIDPRSHPAVSAYWTVSISKSNPFAPTGFEGTCQFPQITREGLEDSYQHGTDIRGVYHDLLGFLPDKPDDTVAYRVTNNVITSQVAGMVASAMWPGHQGPFPLQVQPASIDSLEPRYPCPSAKRLAKQYSVGGSNDNWKAHLTASEYLFDQLDAISDVARSDGGFHRSWDHYYDNLSARQCHGKALPCSHSEAQLCVTQDQADSVYRLGQYEYSYIYRGARESLAYSTASYGVWLAEVVQSLRDVSSGERQMRYRHNIAHDGSIARLLGILQVNTMVWPGMGSEVVFELWRKRSERNYYLRILWSGQVLRSSHPLLGEINMIPVRSFFDYIDELIGTGAEQVLGLCRDDD